MSQKDPKRPGSRDISELKARLGLKKGAAGATGPQAKPNGGGVVPPPGLNLPPPPGAKPPGPVIPNASDDPFGAMNAMASYGTQQRAPEIVIVNDGKPVEQVSSGKKLARVAMIAGPAIAALIIGWIAAGVKQSSDAASAGKNTAGAAKALVEQDLKTLGPLKTDTANTVNDPAAQRKDLEALSAELAGAKDKLTTNKAAVFGGKLDALGTDVRSGISQFYADLDELNAMITDHIAGAETEAAAVKTGNDQYTQFAVGNKDLLATAGGAKYKLALLLPKAAAGQAPSTVILVELGAPLCGADLSSAQPADGGTCPTGTSPVGFLYRTDGTDKAGWSKAGLPAPLDPSKALPADTLLLFGQSQVLDGLVKGPDATQAEATYYNELVAIAKKVKETYDLGETLQSTLNDKSK